LKRGFGLQIGLERALKPPILTVEHAWTRMKYSLGNAKEHSDITTPDEADNDHRWQDSRHESF
jgi:hypothetical protein